MPFLSFWDEDNAALFCLKLKRDRQMRPWRVTASCALKAVKSRTGHSNRWSAQARPDGCYDYYLPMPAGLRHRRSATPDNAKYRRNQEQNNRHDENDLGGFDRETRGATKASTAAIKATIRKVVAQPNIPTSRPLARLEKTPFSEK